jgi:hypothetical protein
MTAKMNALNQKQFSDSLTPQEKQLLEALTQQYYPQYYNTSPGVSINFDVDALANQLMRETPSLTSAQAHTIAQQRVTQNLSSTLYAGAQIVTGPNGQKYAVNNVGGNYSLIPVVIATDANGKPLPPTASGQGLVFSTAQQLQNYLGSNNFQGWLWCWQLL